MSVFLKAVEIFTFLTEARGLFPRKSQWEFNWSSEWIPKPWSQKFEVSFQMTNEEHLFLKRDAERSFKILIFILITISNCMSSGTRFTIPYSSSFFRTESVSTMRLVCCFVLANWYSFFPGFIWPTSTYKADRDDWLNLFFLWGLAPVTQ